MVLKYYIQCQFSEISNILKLYDKCLWWLHEYTFQKHDESIQNNTLMQGYFILLCVRPIT